MASKQRLDILLVDRGLAESRTQAQALIRAGQVYNEHSRLDKPGHLYPPDTHLIVKGQTHPWVSRGGLKLEKGLETFHINPTGKIALDVGASTGGFTDVLLHHGATKVYAVDVGHGQLAWKLRNDERVVVLEKTNARHLSCEQIPEAPDIIVCDASFISLKTVLPATLELAADGAILVALIKPQFEAGREQVGKGGVVRDPAIHAAVCEEIKNWLENLPDWEVLGITESPITGPEGNHEFLIGATKTG